MLHTHLTEQEAEHFYQEAETIAKLTHPYIVRVFDYDVQDGEPGGPACMQQRSTHSEVASTA